MPNQLQLRARAVPGWLRALLITATFLVPIAWVIGDDNLFDWTLAWVTDLAGPTADFRHLLAYLSCVLILLIPTGVALQFLGEWRLRSKSNTPPKPSPPT